MPAPRVTIELVRRYVSEGRGFGHGELYRAFIASALECLTSVCPNIWRDTTIQASDSLPLPQRMADLFAAVVDRMSGP